MDGHNIQIVVLRVVRHSDRHSIVTAYSRQRGRMSFAVPAGAGRGAQRLRALVMPMSVLECALPAISARDLYPLRDVAPWVSAPTVHAHPVKATIAMFAAEVLSAVLRESQGDEALFGFIVEAVRALDALPASRLGNYPIVFLRLLARFTGIEPDYGSWCEGAYFDITEGIFRQTAPTRGRWLGAADSRTVHVLGRLTFSNMHALRLTRAERAAVTDGILQYYTLHLAPLGSLTTLPILRSL